MINSDFYEEQAFALESNEQMQTEMVDLEKLPKTDDSQAPGEEIVKPSTDKEQN